MIKISILALPLVLVWLTGCQSQLESPEAESMPVWPYADEETETHPSPAFDPARYDWSEGFIELSWSVLAKVDFEWQYHPAIGETIPLPVFGEAVRALEGRPVQVKGYVVPLEEIGADTLVVLSAFPYTQCFFCGGAGPESVMDILLREDPGRLPMDRPLTFRGRLRLNATDLSRLFYVLEEAEWER